VDSTTSWILVLSKRGCRLVGVDPGGGTGTYAVMAAEVVMTHATCPLHAQVCCTYVPPSRIVGAGGGERLTPCPVSGGQARSGRVSKVSCSSVEPDRPMQRTNRLSSRAEAVAMLARFKKAVPGKSMRVATTFTGVAACAAIFAPPAMVGPAQPTSARPGHHPLLNGKAILLNTEQRSCKPGTSNWFHLAYAKLSDTCFGFRGAISTTYFATSFCGGNNWGALSGYLNGGAGPHYYTRFQPGTTYAHIPGTSPNNPLEVVAVSIRNLSGTDKCAFP